jgi:hypothetical protein
MKKVGYILVAMVVAVVLVCPAFAQQQGDHQAMPPLIQLLQSKGILTADEAAQVGQAGTADEMNDRLGRLLVQKGLITPEDYSHTVQPAEIWSMRSCVSQPGILPSPAESAQSATLSQCLRRDRL